jgi:hypothetical protein
MSSTEQIEANKKLAREYIEQVFNQHKPDKAANFTSWACRQTASRSVGAPWTSTASPTARSLRSGLPTTSRRSWSRSALSPRPGPRDA